LLDKMLYLIVLACLLNAAAEALATEVTFPGAAAEGYPNIAEVTGYLVFSTGEAKKQVPAVVILHGSGGIDGRGEFHAKALNAAGIATLEVLMFTSGNRPRDGSRSNFTHMYGALKYLANRPDIDPQRIGVTGFSWGGRSLSFLHDSSTNPAIHRWAAALRCSRAVLSCVLAILTSGIRSKGTGIRRV
jgi:dienelactone hydrolase